MRNPLAHLRNEDGQALVEMALVIPLLLFILFAIIDFGEALNQYNDTTNLANIGARAVAVASSTSTNPTCVNPGGTVTSTTLTQYLDCEGATDNGALGVATVCPKDTSGSTWATGDTVQVVVSTQFNWLKALTGGIGRVNGLGVLSSTISSTATMREEASNSTEPAWVQGGASC
jgi:Flp pilus assembly protein TadG